MERWLLTKPQADYMQRLPFIYRADTLRAVRRLVTAKTGYGLLESLYSSTPYSPGTFFQHPFIFCEHNVIGFWCALHEADRYEIRDVRHAPLPQPRVHQYHSWSQWGTERIHELEKLLAADYVPEKVPTKVTAQGWMILDGDVRDGHSSLTEQRGTIEVDVGALPTHAFIKPYLRPGSVVVDVGAHIGNFTIPIMRALGPNGLVIAYEPHPGIFRCLEANVRKEIADNPEAARCVMLRCALGPKRSRASLYCNPCNYASNTLLEGILGPARTEVDMVPLDDSLAQFSLSLPVSFIKIDVEGGEYGVLKGAKEVISRCHPVLFMETSENFFPVTGITEEEFFTYLRSLGYQRFIPFPQAWIDAGNHAHDTLALP
jgi:FkbM family methyltransferase